MKNKLTQLSKGLLFLGLITIPSAFSVPTNNGGANGWVRRTVYCCYPCNSWFGGGVCCNWFYECDAWGGSCSDQICCEDIGQQ